MSESSSGPDLFNLLADEFAERYRRGERPPVSEYTRKYPELAEQIHELFPALVAIEKFGSGADQALGVTAPRPQTALEMPERLGDYHIVREIARGGMGIVYEAVQESLGRHVALKVMPQYRLHDPNQLERFQREARAAAMLHHTNIVPVFGVGEHDGVHYYAMQYIHGQGLDAVLREVKRLRGFKTAEPAPPSVPLGDPASAASVALELMSGRFAGQSGSPAETVSVPTSRPPPPGKDCATTPLEASPGPPASASSIVGQSGSPYYRSVARLGVQVAEALAYAHHHKLLHRDIKPSNLLLDLQGTIWVTDFGLVKAEGTDALTQTGDIVGTLRYMPPERFRGEGDARSDVYALGLTLYEMLTLEPAFAADQRSVMIDKILHEEPSKPRQIDPRIPSDMETIALKAIAKDPSDRYRTASELAEDLRRYLADRPILARRASALEQARRWCRRNPSVTASIATVAAALVAVAVLALLYAGRQRHFAVAQEKANTEITRLNTDLGNERTHLTTALAESNRLLAIRNFDRGQAAFDKGEISLGMLWIVESWRSAVKAGDPVWQHAARTSLSALWRHHTRLKAVLSHESSVTVAAFSGDGNTVLTGAHFGSLRRWDVATAQPIGQPIRHDDGLLSVAFSPDGKNILTFSLSPSWPSIGKVRLWDAATGQPVGSPFPDGWQEVGCFAYSSDGKIIATGGSDTMVRLCDAATYRPIGQPFVHQGPVNSVALSRDGKSLLTLSRAGAAQLWDVATRRPIGQPFNDREFLVATALSPDGKSTVTGGWFGTVQQWSAATGKHVGAPLRHRLKVWAVAYSPDGTTLLTGSEDCTARLWDAVTGQPIGPALTHDGPVRIVAFSPDGKTFLTSCRDNTVRLWDTDRGQPFGLILVRQDVGPRAAFSPDGKWIVSAVSGVGGTAQRWDATTGEIIEPILMHRQGRDVHVAVSPDGKRLLTGGGDTTARLWNAVTGKPIGPALKHAGGAYVVAFCSDGKTMMTAGDGNVRFWDALTATSLGQLYVDPASVDSGVFSPDGKSFVTSVVGLQQVWDLATRAPRGQRFGGGDAACWSPDGMTILTIAEDGGARLWDVKTGTLRTAPLLHQGQLRAGALSPDGRAVLTGDVDGNVRLWDAASGMPLGPTIPHPNAVVTVAFSPDAKTFITGCDDQAVRMFRNVSELPDDLDRIATWVEVLTGLTLGAEHGTLQALDAAAWQERRQQLEKRGGPPETAGGPKLDPIPYGIDPIARGRVLIERGRWDEAEAEFDEVVRARPYNASSWTARAGFRVAHGQPDRAAADFDRAMRLTPEDLRLRSFHVLSLLAQGDQAGLRQACSDLLGRFGATTDHNTACEVAWYCALGADAVADREGPVRVAEVAVKYAPAREIPPVSLNVLGATLYRAGQFEASIRRQQEGIQKQRGESTPQDWAFLAMAHHQLGQRAEALRWLDRVRTYKPTEKPAAFWEELEIRLLRNEAEAVILYDPIFPADPFAP